MSQEEILKEVQGIKWLEPWRACTADEMTTLSNVLAREVGPFHPLFKHRRSLLAAGRSEAQDDVLFISQTESLIAEVHLTWGGRHWFSKEWPSTCFFDSIAEWVERSLREHHKAYAD